MGLAKPGKPLPLSGPDKSLLNPSVLYSILFKEKTNYPIPYPHRTNVKSQTMQLKIEIGKKYVKNMREKNYITNGTFVILSIIWSEYQKYLIR